MPECNRIDVLLVKRAKCDRGDLKTKEKGGDELRETENLRGYTVLLVSLPTIPKHIPADQC